MSSSNQLQANVATLEDILSRLPDEHAAWDQITEVAKGIADSLRNRDSQGEDFGLVCMRTVSVID